MTTKSRDKLLEYLYSERDKWISSSILSEYLSVSTRQIRKYVTKINEDAHQILIQSSNRGYRIDFEVYQGYRTQVKKRNDETPKTRINYIIQTLIKEKGGYNIFDFTEELYVSDATIENDLKSVRSILKKDNLKLKRDKDMIYLLGSEKKKRNLMSHLIASDSYDNFVLRDEVQLLTFHYHFWGFRTTIRDIFAQYDIFANDYTLNNTVLHLIIMIDRIRNNCTLDELVELAKVEDSHQYHVALRIKEFIEGQYNVKINDAELYNLTLVISNNTTMIDYSFITSDNINEFIEQKYIDITNQVIDHVEQCYYLDSFDIEFRTKFTIHVKNLFNRAMNDYYAKNPLTSKIKETYPLIYDIAVFIAQEFKHDYNMILTEDEITFIAFHIGSFFENNVQSKTKVTCAFIYADYYSIHKNVMDRLIKHFDNMINMKYAIAINNYKPTFLHADLIISTVDMPFSNPYVIIHPFLTNRDFKNVESAIHSIATQKRGNALSAYITNFFDEQLFFKNPSFIDKENAIKILSEAAISMKYAQDTLFEDVMAREKMSSTAFGDVAVPHSLSKSAKKSFIAIAISEEPMEWDDHKVHIIVLSGVNEDSRKVFSEVFDELIDILSEPIHVKEIIQSKDFHVFMKLIKQLMEYTKENN